MLCCYEPNTVAFTISLRPAVVRKQTTCGPTDGRNSCPNIRADLGARRLNDASTSGSGNEASSNMAGNPLIGLHNNARSNGLLLQIGMHHSRMLLPHSADDRISGSCLKKGKKLSLARVVGGLKTYDRRDTALLLPSRPVQCYQDGYVRSAIAWLQHL